MTTSRLYEHVRHPHIAARRTRAPITVAGQMPRETWVQRGNARLATWITRGTGTMWCFYLFNVLASTSARAAFASGNPTVIVNWLSSNWLQLILLPAIMVGQNLQARAADARSEQSYHDISAMYHELQGIHQHLDAQDAATTTQRKGDLA